jgi:hypothetical protein
MQAQPTPRGIGRSAVPAGQLLAWRHGRTSSGSISKDARRYRKPTRPLANAREFGRLGGGVWPGSGSALRVAGMMFHMNERLWSGTHNGLFWHGQTRRSPIIPSSEVFVGSC